MIQVNMAYESTKRKWLFGQTSTSEHIESDVSFVAANQQKGTFFEFCLINRKVISVYSRQQCYARLGKGLKALFTNFHDIKKSQVYKNRTFRNTSLHLGLVFFMNSHIFSWKINQPIRNQIFDELVFLGSFFPLLLWTHHIPMCVVFETKIGTRNVTLYVF